MGKYIQLKDANWKVGYLGGWCEGYVSMAWGYSSFTYDKNGNVIGTYSNGKGAAGYVSAAAHWIAKKGNHPGELPPVGITVPVFFKLGNVPEGHIAIMLDDRYVASSTQAGYHTQGYLHKNIDDLISLYGKYNGGCTYLGWSEYVAGVQVVKYEPAITTKDVTSKKDIAFTVREENDNSLPLGERKVKTVGVLGSITTVTRITYSDGKETKREQISSKTVPAVEQVVLVGTYVPAVVKPEPEVPIIAPIEPTTNPSIDENVNVAQSDIPGATAKIDWADIIKQFMIPFIRALTALWGKK
jgi:hypothetical protein